MTRPYPIPDHKEILAASAVSAETGPLRLRASELASVSVDFDSLVGTVELQRRFFEGSTEWRSIKEYTESTEETYEADEGCQIRLVVTARTSGSANLRVGKGG